MATKAAAFCADFPLRLLAIKRGEKCLILSSLANGDSQLDHSLGNLHDYNLEISTFPWMGLSIDYRREGIARSSFTCFPHFLVELNRPFFSRSLSYSQCERGSFSMIHPNQYSLQGASPFSHLHVPFLVCFPVIGFVEWGGALLSAIASLFDLHVLIAGIFL